MFYIIFCSSNDDCSVDVCAYDSSLRVRNTDDLMSYGTCSKYNSFWRLIDKICFMESFFIHSILPIIQDWVMTQVRISKHLYKSHYLFKHHYTAISSFEKKTNKSRKQKKSGLFLKPIFFILYYFKSNCFTFLSAVTQVSNFNFLHSL